MCDRLQVLLDAAPLGFGVDTGLGRAGIFRATERLVLEALRHPELDVHVAALDHYLAEIQLLRYDRAAGTIGPRRVTAWQHPARTHDDTAHLVDRIVEAGEANPVTRGLHAELALSQRLARATPVPARYDVFHSLRARLVSRPMVSARVRAVTVYDAIPLQHPEWFEASAVDAFRAIVDSIDPRRDWVICNAACVRHDLTTTCDIPEERIAVVPLAADPEHFHPVTDPAAISRVRHHYGLGDRPYLLSVCTLEPRKNLQHLVTALPDLLRDPAHSDLQLVLAGALGWKTDSLLAALAHSPVRDRILLTGFVRDADLAPLYAGADVFVYPSHYEGFGLPVLEAMQCGTPVVTTTGGALPDVAGSAAALVPADSRIGLLDAIARARNNPAMREAGLQRVRHFTWRRTLDLTVSAYRAMLSRS